MNIESPYSTFTIRQSLLCANKNLNLKKTLKPLATAANLESHFTVAFDV